MIFLSCALWLVLSGCTVLGFGEPVWKSIITYNNSSKSIYVTSLEGIGAFRKGGGPQNLGAGNMKPTLYKTIETMGDVQIKYPVKICWVDELLHNSSAEWPTSGDSVHQQEILAFRGLAPDVHVIRDEGSLLFIFTGTAWEAYYIAGKSGLGEDEILRVIGNNSK